MWTQANEHEEKKESDEAAHSTHPVGVAKCEKLPGKTKNELWQLVDCYYSQKSREKTLETLKTLSRQEPQELDAFFTAAWLLWQDGQALGGSAERKKTLDALEVLERARLANPTHWEVYTELGDFYYLRFKPSAPEKALPEYQKAREYYDGDYARKVPKASLGRKASIENRIARSSEKIGRNGEAVEASCRALFFDPDDKGAQKRMEKLSGSCVKKDVKNPLEVAE